MIETNGDIMMIMLYIYIYIYIYNCCGLQIRLVEEQLKQRVIGEHYCISRSWLAVCLSNVS